MAEAIVPRSAGLSFKAAIILLAAVLLASSPICWSLEAVYGVDKLLASNIFWTIFVLVYATMLALPWLNLAGQEHFSTAQRMERMVVTWLGLITAPHLFWELPWVAFYSTIMAGKGQMWAYAWWAYMDGGDMRYVTRDAYLVAMESGASMIGILTAVLLWQRNAAGRFSDRHLIIIMALIVADFYPTYMYYVTEMFQGFPNVNGVMNLVVKFVAANAFWLIMPWTVFVWAGRQLASRRRLV